MGNFPLCQSFIVLHGFQAGERLSFNLFKLAQHIRSLIKNPVLQKGREQSRGTTLLDRFKTVRSDANN